MNMKKTIQKIKAIKRKNGLWVAYTEGVEMMAQARTKSAAILLFSLGQFNIKN